MQIDWGEVPYPHVQFAAPDTRGTWYWFDNGVTWRVDSGELERPELPLVADEIIRRAWI